MSDSAPTPSQEPWQREERLIQRDLAAKQELEAVLTRFHDLAHDEPDVWKDPQAVGEALRAASELRDLDHELALTYLQRLRRDEATRRHQPNAVAPPPPTPEQIHRAHALEAYERYDREIDQLRTLGAAPELVRRADRERRARLRLLLDLLATVQPETASRIERTLETRRSQPENGPGGSVSRFERQTGDWLARFLEPLLPE